MKKLLFVLLAIVVKDSFCYLYIPQGIREKYGQKKVSPTPWLRSRSDLYKELPKGGVVAEIGVQRGVNAEQILKHAEPKHLYLIDCWSSQSESIYTNDASNGTPESQDNDYNEVKRKFAGDSRVTIIKAFSPEVASLFEDNFFDWIYIDSNHSYEAVKKDLEGWFLKVKPGGIIAGHDYAPWEIFGVIPAVNEFVATHKLRLEFLTNEGGIMCCDSYGIRK